MTGFMLTMCAKDTDPKNMRAQATDAFLNKKWGALEAVKKKMTKNQEHILLHKYLT